MNPYHICMCYGEEELGEWVGDGAGRWSGVVILMKRMRNTSSE